MKNSENRYVIENSKLRAYTEDDKKIIEGRAIPFNSESRLLYEDNKEFNEIIIPEATESSDFSRAYLTYNHSRDDVFATVRANSLTTFKDEEGISFRAVLNNTQKANDMYEMVRSGDIAGLSFNMIVGDRDYTYSRGEDGKLKRVIHNIRAILEISLISGLMTPAYAETKVWARGFDEYLTQEQEAERKKKEFYTKNKNFIEKKIDIYNISNNEKV